MFIRMKVGRYAGEIRDVQNEAARMLLAKGAAEDPYAQKKLVMAGQSEIPFAPVAEGTKTSKKKARA
ncbi:MAG: hypothetical protein ACYDC6_11020 [Acidobacteriaceae bacterium]